MQKEDYEILGFSLERIRNTYEVKVIDVMKEEINNFPEFDRCQLCIEDVYALTLSRMPSTYVQPGSIVFRKEVSDEEVRDVVQYSIIQVMQQPKHSQD